MRARLTANDNRLGRALTRRRHTAESRFTALAARLDGLSPLAVLARGYAVCWDDGRTTVIRSQPSVAPGDAVVVTLAEGELRCEVREAQPAHPDQQK